MAVSVSLAVSLSPAILGFAAPHSPNPITQTDSVKNDVQLISVDATPTPGGVLLEWHTNVAPDNIGFNVYRVVGGKKIQANREIIPGVQFAPGPPAMMRGGYSFSWFDRNGTADSVYIIESVSVDGTTKTFQSITPAPGPRSRESQSSESPSAPESPNSFEKQTPAVELQQPNIANGTLQQQWAIVAQPALKIAIKKEGWYRVTQAQMVATGFNPTVDIRNLRLFLNADELAIATSQSSGLFGTGDYIEFYGQGLDIATTDTNTYYLIAGTTPGKRVGGEFQVDDGPPPPPPPPATPLPTIAPAPTTPPITPTDGPILRDPVFYSFVYNDLQTLSNSLQPTTTSPTRSKAPADDNRRHNNQEPSFANVIDGVAVTDQPTEQPSETTRNKPEKEATVPPAAAPSMKLAAAPAKPAPSPVTQGKAGKSRKKKKRWSVSRKKLEHHHHAMLPQGFVAPNFDSTIQIKNRGVYLSNLLNGDTENWFGNVISTTPVTLTLNAGNPDTTSVTQARIEVALQGVMSQAGNPHAVRVELNNVVIDPAVNFGPLDHPVRVINVPASQILNGANQLKFIKTSTGEVCLVDYVRFTYPHVFKADSGALKFSLIGTQTVKVDGFASSLVKLIDYTDPLNVRLIKPDAETTASGYAITVPTNESAGKKQRLLYAIPQGQSDTPASLSLNTPSTLNLGSNLANYLIIAHKNFMASIEPLRIARSSTMIAKTVDVEDIYDEFSFGVHGPEAIRTFLQYAATHWNNGSEAPRYVVFAGDASYDPRNYTGQGNLDFVPTKLVDATYNETCSDDWLTDFNDDGVADIPVGRLPIGNPADATLIVNKIINFTPLANQSAILVADDPTGYYFNFETANDGVATLLPPGMTVQKAYRALQLKPLTGTLTADHTSATLTGTGTLFQSELQIGDRVLITGQRVGTVASIASNTSLTLQSNSLVDFNGAYGKQDDPTATANIKAGFNQGRALANYSGHGNVDVWTGASIFKSADALALTNGNNKLSFVVVMDCLNGYFQAPELLSLSEAFLKAPNGGAVAAFASSGLTLPDGQHEMSTQLYTLIYGGPPIALGDAIKASKFATNDIDVRRTWIFFGDPALKIR
jgi:hypothetical protein